MENNVVIFKDYVKKFKNTKIGPLNFEIEKGKTTAILGASGSGKSVVIKTIIGAISNFEGDVRVCGYSKKKRKAHLANKDVSFYTQMDFSLYEMNVVTYLKNMCIVLGVEKKSINHKVDYWLDFFDLKKDAHKKIKNFSWGMQNRLSLILSLIKDTDIIILDEPGANLDSSWRNKMRNLLIDYKNRERTVVITSHNIDEINDLIDYYVVLDKGKLVFKGSKIDLNMYAKYKMYFYERFDYESFQKFLNGKNIKAFKYDELENSIVFATNSTKEINWIFLYLIKETTPILNLVKLPVNMDSIYKALEDSDQFNKDLIENNNVLDKKSKKLALKLEKKAKKEKDKKKNFIEQKTTLNNSLESVKNVESKETKFFDTNSGKPVAKESEDKE
ncbi:ABC transporter ATP-binding protein [Spiroplasma turonicum]|uniref:ABC transporter ATP-binding protein n=1 Tax=Spiroplasma turonicum TaxID=216946 RepID=A0A0K1P6U9_9MOLU|nr:ABC transporter ATP-binding protein [Spiroplasma turonicum]AKU79607.1 ABC transporter ATP-binding protein [Spiroplasma turonicum]ALX70629.1 ABC transporter ATP-binding protein [Spiroplasma turonicum]